MTKFLGDSKCIDVSLENTCERASACLHACIRVCHVAF